MSWTDDTIARAQHWLKADDALRAISAIDNGHSRVSASTEEALELRFGIGSITKTMTATVLCALHIDGSTSLDTPIGTYLPAGRNGDITLRQLANHTSGLPRLSPNAFDHDGYDPADPYAAFTEELALSGLREVTLNEQGQAYSNFGYQILGLALEAAAGSTLAELYRSLIWTPLAMADTELRSERTDRLAPGRHRGRPVPRWRSPVPGPGGVEVTVADMARYLAAVLSPPDGLVGDALRLATGGADRKDLLGWFRTPDGLLVHDGGEAGVAALALVDRKGGRAVATLAAKHPDKFGQVALACLRGGDPPAPPCDRSIDEDHPAWATFRSALTAITAKDAQALIALLADQYRRNDQAVKAIPDELAELGSVHEDTLRPLPGSPPGAVADLSDGRELLMVADPDSHRLAGFMPMTKGATPPW